MEESTKNGSSFIKELEDRLNDIFEEEKPKQAEPAAPPSPEPAGAAALDSIKLQEEAGGTELLGDLDESHSVMFSHIKELKSVVLSLEWELNDETLARFDEEILKLEEVYAEDLFVLAFVRILRFLGRYIMVKGTESEPRSINLLFSTYDNLEKVLLSRNMPESEKYSLMAENISSYRQWVETEDLTSMEVAEPGEMDQGPAAGRPVLQVVAGGQDTAEARSEVPAFETAEDYSQTAELAQKFAEVSREEASSAGVAMEISQPEAFRQLSSPAESSSPLDEIELEGEAAQWKKAVEKDNITAARSIETEPVYDRPPYVQDALDEIRTDDTAEKDVIPARELQAEESRPEEIIAADVREGSVEPAEIEKTEYPERVDALAPDLERLRQEIRDEVLEELRGEIDSLRDQIRYLAKKINWDEQ